jgi:hypothetical protein
MSEPSTNSLPVQPAQVSIRSIVTIIFGEPGLFPVHQHIRERRTRYVSHAPQDPFLLEAEEGVS